MEQQQCKYKCHDRAQKDPRHQAFEQWQGLLPQKKCYHSRSDQDAANGHQGDESVSNPAAQFRAIEFPLHGFGVFH